MSTPHGTTRIDRRGTPSLVRSDSSSELPATTALTVRPIAGSSRIRSVPAPAGIIPCRRSVTTERVERLHHGNAQVAGGRQGREPAGPAQRVHHVGAVLAPSVVQRLAERRRPALSRWESSSAPAQSDGPTYSTLTPGASLARSGSDALVAARVHGHLVAVAGQARAHLDQPGVVAARAWSLSPGTGVACWATRAIFISGCLSSIRGAITASCRRRNPQSEAARRIVAARARTPRWRGRACVVGTTGATIGHRARPAEHTNVKNFAKIPFPICPYFQSFL